MSSSKTQVPNVYVSFTISTETAPLKVHNVILNMNNQRVILLVLLDLSAAFDTVDPPGVAQAIGI